MADLWELLNQDVAWVGNLYSPVLSWLGVCAMVLFFIRQVMKLKKEVGTVQHAFKRVYPTLTNLAEERRSLIRDPFTPAPHNSLPKANVSPSAPPIRVDRDDLHMLDAGMEHEPLFRSLWRQYRMTLLVEQVPWFLEPRIFATKRAGEVFTQEALLANQVNLAFSRQVPSLITGFGLLLTFLALLIGLGKLHAEGNEIMGIQGLINGLAGKFLTSIVGLSLAQLFLFMEKPLMSRLTTAHRAFLDQLDQLFPRKTMEQMLDQLISGQNPRPKEGARTGENRREQTEGWETASLVEPAATLTAAIQSLREGQQEEQIQLRQTITELLLMIRGELQTSLHGLTDTIQNLTRLLKEVPHPEPVETAFEDRPLLWKAPAYPRDPTQPNLPARTTPGPRRPQLFARRRTG